MTRIITKLFLSNLKNFLFIFIGMLLVIMPFILIYFFNPELFNSINTEKEHSIGLFRLVRWSIILVFIVLWPYLVNWLGKRRNVPFEKILQWRQEIYRIAVWLVLFELLICENLFYKLLNALSF